MSTTISPLRRITVTLALTGAAAFSAVAIAPSAFADESTAYPTVTAPAVTDPAVVTPPVVVPPAVVLDKNGKPVKAPKYCTDKDLNDSAKKIADAVKKAAPLFSLATSSHKAADLVRAQEPKMTVKQVPAAEALANGLDMVGNKLAAQAQASIDKASVLDCFIVAGPDDRF
ncbi:MAG: hypothetical protein QOJ68_409 [Blastococcus sp.]|jgi:hypothetical protein|nr:hypothetical protein [Blastococcus sp.]